jgi:formylglycine-generating enzyme required for sulfatase activity
MKRLILIFLALLLLSGIGVVVWSVAGLPPVRMAWRYGFSYAPEPTGRKRPIGGIEFVEIGPGCFRMGSDQHAEGGDQPKPSDEMPVHWVEFPRGFLIAETEVTNKQHEAFNPKHERSEYSPGDNDPVVDVSWEDAKKYCAWLSEKSGQAIRLPSESEWECACRAGSKREFCFGDDEMRLGEYAWHDANSDSRAHEVGTRRANAWGLHDFHGNVWEWCEDTYHESYKGAPADGTAWTEGGKLWQGAPFRVCRGGCFVDWAVYCRSAFRGWDVPGFRWRYLGFRPAFWPLDH